MDSLQYEHLATKWSQYELGLYSTKWFDYRHLHPLEATATYMDAWNSVQPAIYDEYFGRNTNRRFKYPLGKDIAIDLECDEKARKHIKGCWRGRQCADALCMPYPDYIRAALEMRLKGWKQRFFPPATMLYKPEIVDKVEARWEEMRQTRLYFPNNWRYKTAHYVGTPHQKDCHQFLVDQARSRQNSAPLVADAVGKELIGLDHLESFLSADEIARVRSYL